MPDKFRHKYRIASARLKNWDYSSNGYYFITICTKNRKHFFGEIVETQNFASPQMQLSDIGSIAKKYWLEIPNHFPFVALDEFVVMPNHIHGIVVINKNIIPNIVETPNLGVSTTTTTTTTTTITTTNINAKINYWKSGCVGTMINQYKRICTIQIRKNCNYFAWQPRFYDHIIRNKQSFVRIHKYIKNNTLNWKNDRNNSENLWI